jgi:hypothetical protein
MRAVPCSHSMTVAHSLANRSGDRVRTVGVGVVVALNQLVQPHDVSLPSPLAGGTASRVRRRSLSIIALVDVLVESPE